MLTELSFASMVALTRLFTGEVVTVNVAEFAPAFSETFAGTIAAELLEERATDSPPTGAGPRSVTVPVAFLPPRTVAGLRLTDARLGVHSLKLAVLDTEFDFPVIVAVTLAVTGEVVIVNVADFDPAATVTVAGTLALEMLEERETFAPPVCAGPSKLTVPITLCPPITGEALTLTEEMAGASTVNVAVTLTALSLAVIVAA